MPLFTYPFPPLLLSPDGAMSSILGGAGTAVTAGSAYLMPITTFAPVTVVSMRTAFSGAPTGNCDMGIYDSGGVLFGPPTNLLGHTGAIAATTGMFTKSLIANLTLPPGQYWLAFLDTVADSVILRGSTTGILPTQKTTSTALTVLPASAGATADNNLFPYCVALLLNSFS